MITADAFHWFVYGFGDMARLDDTFLNSWDVPLLDGLIGLIVQAFYCWRIYFLLRKGFLIPGLILLVSLIQCAAGVVTAVRAHELGHLSKISTEVVPQTVWLVGGAVADVAIAGVLAWALLRERGKSLPVTQSLITRAIRLIVETNAITASVAVIALILFWGVPQQPTLVVPPTAIMGKLYTNCLITVFNNRVSEGKDSHGSGVKSLNLPRERSGRQQNSLDHNNPVKVHVVRQLEVTFESPMELREYRKPTSFN
ncbi:hypothetical protein B0H15DRAFT_31882 [Mycena belliarum]|uniref:DUF6534 domain-containing protein n=1 Tax=Mycena belliarum TaxID=1033014 RepID=A0AAD6UAD7_9AGAR|nr:hypothetical protein B0H15DRAFT_31882 [Mycena belliae]